jgi:hypothetical protein
MDPRVDGEVLAEWERSISWAGGRWRQRLNGEVAAKWAMVSSAAVRREGQVRKGVLSIAESSWLSLVVRAFVAGHRRGTGCEVMPSTLGPCGWGRGDALSCDCSPRASWGGDDTAPLASLHGWARQRPPAATPGRPAPLSEDHSPSKQDESAFDLQNRSWSTRSLTMYLGSSTV